MHGAYCQCPEKPSHAIDPGTDALYVALALEPSLPLHAAYLDFQRLRDQESHDEDSLERLAAACRRCACPCYIHILILDFAKHACMHAWHS